MKDLRILYFEGPDGAGKTTRIKEIMDGFDVYCHNGVYPSLAASYDAYDRQLSYFEEVPNSTGIFDRMIFSDVIYSDICRNVKVPQSDVDAICERLNNIGASLIICLPPYEVCYSNWRTRRDAGGEYEKSEHNFERLYDAYTDLAATNKDLPIEIYDYTKELL